jgi:hypothetical protein
LKICTNVIPPTLGHLFYPKNMAERLIRHIIGTSTVHLHTSMWTSSRPKGHHLFHFFRYVLLKLKLLDPPHELFVGVIKVFIQLGNSALISIIEHVKVMSQYFINLLILDKKSISLVSFNLIEVPWT